MVVDALALAGAGVIGVVGGLGISLIIKSRRKPIPQAGGDDEWAKLKRLTDERAIAASRQKALQKAYAGHSIEEGTYITKEAHYAKLISRLDAEIDDLVHHLSQEFAAGEVATSQEGIRRLSDLSVVTSELGDLRQMKEQIESERDQLHVQLSEVEDDKKTQLIEKNRLRDKYNDAELRVKTLRDMMARAKGEKETYKERAKAYEKQGSNRNLLDENRMLREGLSRTKDSLSLTKNELAIMSALVDRHAEEIEGKELRTPSQMKSLVTLRDKDVMRVAKELGTGPKIFKFVRDNIREVHPHINATYWMKPEEVLRIGGADHEDRMILLCSLMRALGLEATVVTVEMQNKLTRSVVGLEDKVLDPRNNANWNDYEDLSIEGALKKYAFDGFGVRRTISEFNDKTYRKV